MKSTSYAARFVLLLNQKLFEALKCRYLKNMVHIAMCCGLARALMQIFFQNASTE